MSRSTRHALRCGRRRVPMCFCSCLYAYPNQQPRQLQQEQYQRKRLSARRREDVNSFIPLSINVTMSVYLSSMYVCTVTSLHSSLDVFFCKMRKFYCVTEMLSHMNLVVFHSGYHVCSNDTLNYDIRVHVTHIMGAS